MAAVVAGGCAEAWRSSGSIVAEGSRGWLPYAVVLGLLVATVLVSGGATRPVRAAWLAGALLVALAAWAYASLAWSSVPALARDEGLLTLVYALALVLPALALRAAGRRAALVAAALILGAFALAVAITLAAGAHPATRFFGGRLYFPITYANAQGAFFALGFWPAVLLAAQRQGRPALRVAMTGVAAALLTATTMTQSKGAILGLLVALIVLVAASPARLRLLVPVAIATAIDAAAFAPLTAPFRQPGDPAARNAGVAVLAGAGAALVAGGVYVAIDRRVEVPERARRLAAQALTAAAVLAAAALVAGFFLSVAHPVRWSDDRWQSFTHLTRNETGGSHFVNFGSNRYDYWRVAVKTFERHPVAGCGARCFGPVYLVERRSGESPARAHSLPLEVLAEQGVVGFALIVAALAILLAGLWRLARARDIVGTAALGAAVGWTTHASVDWIWTFPAVTAPLFAIAGIGLAYGTEVLPVRVARAGAAAAVAAAVLAFAPVALAGWLTERALDGSASRSALRWARRLDPVSTAPVVAQALTSTTSRQELSYLRTAARMEPRVVSTQYLLGVAYLNTGRKADARAQLQRALRLDPQNPSVLRALRLAR